MAHFFRLVVFALLTWAGSAAAAVLPGAPTTLFAQGEFSQCQSNNSNSAHVACTVSSAVWARCAFGTQPAGSACFSLGWGTGDIQIYLYRSTSLTCPAHSILNGSSCKCDTGYVELNGQCQTPGSVCVGKATQAAIAPGVTQEFSTTKPTSTGGMFAPRKVCIEGCQASGTPSYWACGGSNCTVHFENASYTGAVCSGDGGGTAPASDPVPTPVADRCPDGKVPGTVNGTNVCVTPGEAGSASSTSGSTTNTGTNPDGTAAPGTSSGTGSTSQTSCNGTTCTTTTTTNSTSTNGSGQTSTAGETTTKTEPQASHCASNPKAKECAGNEPTQSSFSGACESGFVAKGDDAVLNAMAKEQYTRNCQVLTLASAEATVVANASDATGLQKVTTAGDSSVAISSGNFDTSNSLGGGGCSLNKTITVAHMTATLPFNVICDPLAYLGQVLVAVSLLLAARIVARG